LRNPLQVTQLTDFTEGWIPTLAVHDDELLIGLPKKIAIPLLVAYFLLQAANYSLDLHAKTQDLRLKHLDIQLKQIELKLKEEELNNLASSHRERLQEKASKCIQPVLKNELISTCSINGLPIK
jgi:hypothetical protein